ncbi:SidA/IucD/PvdA family monooxygenase [Nocardia alni]|uniref:SidA/IucD/PvdA family monooxygenase n=1 Tax=Nocardia alni TaxID=2815723 RepID=UPI001C227E2E|nr:SidA/IucD/PvdA family monooxygenase [Nocardia alni]
MTDPREYDLIGIGFGPANIALAIALEEDPDTELRTVFVEKSPVPQWQENMLLGGSDIQHHPLRDLVSLRNPRSRYSFTNYLFENQRLIEHLNLPTPFPLRIEYADYISWVRRTLSAPVIYGTAVIGIEFDPETDLYTVTTSDGDLLTAPQVSLGPGRTPLIPDEFVGTLDSRRVVHLTDYLSAAGTFDPATDRRIGIVGGSQSAVELALDIRRRFPAIDVGIITRSWSLRAKDHSPFSEEIYFPQFTDYYHRSSKAARRRLDLFTRPTNYSAADLDVLERLYAEMYEDRLHGRSRTLIYGDSEIVAVASGPHEALTLTTRNATTGHHDELVFDRVVLATGFRDMGGGQDDEHHHPLLGGVHRCLRSDSDGDLLVERDYSVRPVSGTAPIYLNGLCESTHGIGDAGSFSLLSLRAELIARSILDCHDRSRAGTSASA